MQIKEVATADVLPIRQIVLRPGERINAARVCGDATALHLGAFDGGLIGAASLFFNAGEVRLRKFAVLPDWQGRGVGSALLRHMIATTDAPLFWCDARVAAVPFYQRHGLRPVGEQFVKGRRDYVRMERRS